MSQMPNLSGSIGDSTAPLTGIRVIELGRALSAPWAGQLLADMGAEVIKVERPGVGDDFRAVSPHLKDPQGRDTRESALYLSTNRNKKSITANLASVEGQAIIRELVQRSDVLIENYKVGDLARYGLDPASLKEVNPALVYCSITGFGQTGPLRELPAYDSICQAFSGMMAVTGIPDDEPGAGVVKIAPSVNDLFAGYNAAFAIVNALMYRNRSGEGQSIDISMLDGATAVMAHMSQAFLLSGQQPKRMGTETAGGGPNGVYRCRDGDVLLSAGNNLQFRSLCDAIGLQDLANDARFQSNVARAQHRTAMREALQARLAQIDVADVLQRLGRASVPAAPVNDIAQALSQPQVVQRGMVRRVPHSLGVDVAVIGSPIRLERSPAVAPQAAPTLGQHNDEVLGTLLGMTPEAITALRAAGAV